MTELLAGLSLGLGAGITPGPLLTLVLTSTLERGTGAGVRVAVAPLLTDAPIIALTVAVVSSVAAGVLRGLGVGGGLVVAVVGVMTVAGVREVEAEAAVPDGRDVWKGVLVNALSPHPWIFWISVGAPLLLSSWRESPVLGVLFLVGFYSLLVGSKVALAFVVGRNRSRLSVRARSRLIVIGGALLVVGGLVLVWEAARGSL